MMRESDRVQCVKARYSVKARYGSDRDAMACNLAMEDGIFQSVDQHHEEEDRAILISISVALEPRSIAAK
jgi:hypothetical protein